MRPNGERAEPSGARCRASSLATGGRGAYDLQPQLVSVAVNDANDLNHEGVEAQLVVAPIGSNHRDARGTPGLYPLFPLAELFGFIQ